MEFHYSVFIVLVLLTGCLALDPLEVFFNETGPINVRDGAENVELNCKINRGPMFMMNHLAEIIHHSAVTGQNITMSRSGLLLDAQPNYYDVAVLSIEDNKAVLVKFVIKTVRPEDDGTFICKVTGAGVDTSATVDLVVVRNFDSLHLKFGDDEPISKALADPIEIDTGTYTVKCIANGSNPSTDKVHMYLNGEKVDTGTPVITMLQDSVQRQYSTVISADIDILLKNSGQAIECNAKSPGEGGNQLAVSLTVHVNTYEPEVTCNDTSAYAGMMNTVLVCMVNHTDITVVSYKFQFGETGEIVAESTNAGTASVKSKPVTDVLTMVELTLDKAESHHFNMHYYLLIEDKDGHVTKSRVMLIEKPAPTTTADPSNPDHANSTKMSFAAISLGVLCSLLWRQF